MKIEKSLSKGEWSIMNICWKKGKSTARVIFDESIKKKRREYQTVKTMLDRLEVKGFLKREKFGPLWLYEPTISRAKALTNAIDFFVDNVLDNTLTPLFAHFVNKEKLSADEIKALEKLIEKSKKE